MAEKERPLSPKQLRFVEEYLLDLNATQAAIRAGYSEKTACEQAARLLANVKVQAAIQAAQAKRSERTEITADMVLERWWALATADPNELTQLRRECCRHCYGKDHAYQWRDEAEFVAALALAQKHEANADPGTLPPLPSDEGGYGYDPKLSPHARCPKCDGDGLIDVYFADTRKLSPGGKLLFAGVEQTQHGLKVKMNSQPDALNNVARHLGMFAKDKVVAVKVEELTDDDIDAQIAALEAVKASGTDAGAGGEA